MKNDLPDIAALEALLREQRHAYRRAPYPSWEARAARIVKTTLLDNRDALADAMNADFGNRAKQEVLLSEFLLLKGEIDGALRHGRRWMKAQRRSTNKWLPPARMKAHRTISGARYPYPQSRGASVAPEGARGARGARGAISL